MLAAGAGCTGLQALNPVCQVGTIVSGVGGAVAGAGFSAVLSGVSQWVANGAEWLLGQVGNVLFSTTKVDLGADWFRHNYAIMTALAGVVVLPLLLVSALQAIFRQNPAQLVRAFLVQLPLALLLGVISIQIVVLCLSATDALCNAVAGGASSSVSQLLASLSASLVSAVGDPAVATFVVLLVGLLVACAAFVLWLELLVRAAAVYVAALFLPLALITLVWPSVSHWCRRLVETLAALILSKFVIVATLSLAAGAIASGTDSGGGHASSFASVLAGGALLVLATFVPFAILRLIPMVEAGAVAHLEGARQRSTSALTRVPRSAASFALTEGLESLGAARLAAAAGPVGTGRSGGGASGAARADDAALVTGAERVGESGLAVGIPGSLEERLDSLSRTRAGGKGPKPIVGWKPEDALASEASEASEAPGAAGAAGESEELPPDFRGWVGPQRPDRNRHYMGSDGHGPTLKFLPPTVPRAPLQPPADPGPDGM
jgi:hypothetical protein